MPSLPSGSAGAYSRGRVISYEAGASVSEYDALHISAGAVIPAGDGDVVHGVATGDAEAGELVEMAVSGAYPARVDPAVVAGDRLAGSASAGVFGGGTGPTYALTDPGDSVGLYHGGALDSDIAIVNL